jgi:hypothetical protein
MQEFEIILFQTQSLSIKPKGSLVLQRTLYNVLRSVGG